MKLQVKNYPEDNVKKNWGQKNANKAQHLRAIINVYNNFSVESQSTSEKLSPFQAQSHILLSSKADLPALP